MACGSFRRRRSSCASSFSRWQLSCCSPRSRAPTRHSRSEQWTAAATIAVIRSGEKRTRNTSGLPGRITPTGSRGPSAARPSVTSATVSSATRVRTCSRRTASPSGASSGDSSWTTRSACVRKREARTRRSRSVPPTGSRASPTHWARSRSCARPPHRVPAGAGRLGSRSTPSRATSTASASTAGVSRGSSGCARARSTEGSPTTGQSCCWIGATCRAETHAATPLPHPRWR